MLSHTVYIILYAGFLPFTVYLKHFPLLFKTFKVRGQAGTENRGYFENELFIRGSTPSSTLFLQGNLAFRWPGDSGFFSRKLFSRIVLKKKKILYYGGLWCFHHKIISYFLCSPLIHFHPQSFQSNC